MSLKSRLRENLLTGTIGAALTVALGLVLRLPVGDCLKHLSYDLPFAYGSRAVPSEVIIIKMDKASHEALHQTPDLWDRKLHAQLLDKLRSDQSGMAVFDVVFAEASTPESDADFARAIKAHGNVVLAADIERISDPRLAGGTMREPLKEFCEGARGWGLHELALDTDEVVRELYLGTEFHEALPKVAAVLAKRSLTNLLLKPDAGRWVRYYGPSGTIASISFHNALKAPQGYFKDKAVFVAVKPSALPLREPSHSFQTPYTLWDGKLTCEVEIHATMFLNLVRGDWLKRLSTLKEVSLLIVGGLLLGYGLAIFRPLASAGLALLVFVLIAALAIWLFRQQHIWFSWLVMAGAQVPCALLWSGLAHTLSLHREKPEMKKELASTLIPVGAIRPCRPNPIIQSAAGTRRSPSIPDYALVRCVGEGSFSQVWLARNTIRMFHAVRIVSRRAFEDADPYERKFHGIQKYMPISQSHPGLVAILRVDRNDEAGYFYSIMQAADDEITGQKIDPDTYSPRTLSKDLKRRGRIPVEECVSLSLALTTGLDYLHQQQLIHRDIRPSNIIFVNGIPKLAEIGAVIDIRRKAKDGSNLGTEGYMAPEGPSAPTADLYSLGKVIYVASMGKSVLDYPALPTNLNETGQQVELLQLNQIILKACEEEAQERYQSAEEMHADLLRLQRRLAAGKS